MSDTVHRDGKPPPSLSEDQGPRAQVSQCPGRLCFLLSINTFRLKNGDSGGVGDGPSSRSKVVLAKMFPLLWVESKGKWIGRS